MAKKTNALTAWIAEAKATYNGKLPKVHRDPDCVTEFNVGYKDAKHGSNYAAGCMDKDTAEFFLKHLTDAFALGEANAVALQEAAEAGAGFKTAQADEETA